MRDLAKKMMGRIRGPNKPPMTPQNTGLSPFLLASRHLGKHNGDGMELPEEYKALPEESLLARIASAKAKLGSGGASTEWQPMQWSLVSA